MLHRLLPALQEVENNTPRIVDGATLSLGSLRIRVTHHLQSQKRLP